MGRSSYYHAEADHARYYHAEADHARYYHAEADHARYYHAEADHARYYHAEADHARRLADMTIQPNVEDVLRRVAEEFDRLADDFTTGEVDFHHPESLEHS